MWGDVLCNLLAKGAQKSKDSDVGRFWARALFCSDTKGHPFFDPVPAHRFEIELNRSGEVLRKTFTPMEFLLPAVCASPKNELTQFCTEAKRAVEW
ncbi:MAG: hypothetical protein FJ184_13140 [Gammaproteobacteria bacterium]|nr:hypothetical protein [Gammaproteobacteria bacterium]